MTERPGQCLCGTVRYRLKAAPIVTAVCHCKHCQRQAGSAFSVVVVAPAASVEIEGELKTYRDTADSGAALDRRFCPNCGSAMFSVQPDQPGTIIIKAGSFDETGWLKPVAHVWCNSAQPWVEISGKVAKFPGNAPSG
ncbi:MAG: aldehyde-activating protein [Rhizobiales bacterium]|nr:aldehyde-activating protein [Hyphomicrobiales bacterium]|tara:strand:+ start:149 stop:562 length:414 start_codon:yes stop_codon:yes gene_type:complete